MDADLTRTLIADGALALAFCALMTSLATVSRHPALGGGVRFALGHIGFAAGSGLFILLADDPSIDAGHRMAAYWGALLLSTAGAAAMVDGMARLLEHPRRAAIGRAAWIVAGVLLAFGLLPVDGMSPQRLASDLVNTLGMLGLAIVLLRQYPAPYRMPAWTAGGAVAILSALYLLGAVQGWSGLGPVVLPPYPEWVWLDLALWNTINLCVMMLASFRALVVFARRSRTDPLTHCLNRSGFDDELRALAIRMPQSVPVVVLVMDIDHFKAINDQLGHAAGDAYLERFAQVLQSCVRQSDLVARIGGEEFVAVLVDAHLDAGERVASKILDTVRTVNVLCDGELVRTTVSIGVADGFGISAVDTLLRRADRAMYVAKSCGRDRVVTAGPAETTGTGVAIDARGLRQA